MREKLLLFLSFVFLYGGADHALFVTPSVAEGLETASNPQTIVASLKPVAPIRRVLVEQTRKREQEAAGAENRTHYRQRVQRTKDKGQRNVNHSTTKLQNHKTRIHPAVDKKDIAIEHRLIANEVIKLMPTKCHDNLKNFYVRYGLMEGRGLGGASTIIITA